MIIITANETLKRLIAPIKEHTFFSYFVSAGLAGLHFSSLIFRCNGSIDLESDGRDKDQVIDIEFLFGELLP
jgi:hypothetical protein